MKKWLQSIFIANRAYLAVGLVITLLVVGFFFEPVYILSKYALLALIVLFIADFGLLWRNKKGVYARRDTMEKLSNGDGNAVQVVLENLYAFPAKVKLVDELPMQFQLRNQQFVSQMQSGTRKTISYTLRPVKRGEYHFGALNVFVQSPIGLLARRFKFSQDMVVPVYPSFIQMKKYELLAISNRLMEFGIKKIRRIGHTTEFEQIKKYVMGDDFRTVNWKATARKGKLMVNQYQEERSQQVYSIIDMGRAMKMPFGGLSLLDYSINASLVISNIALLKHDKAGIITFSKKIRSILKAERRSTQLRKILELLYNQKTDYQEPNFEALYGNVKHKINQRSLLLLYTNFESLSGLQRQMRYLKALAKSHLLVVIFFENTELRDYINQEAQTVHDVYKQTIAEKMAFEKKQIVGELKKQGIQSILTAPENLSVNTINKYLELKARGLI